MADVRDLLERLPYLGQGELMALAGAHEAEGDARRAAWRAVEAAARARDGGRDLDRLRAEVTAWATRLDVIVGYETGTSSQVVEARRAAAPAVLDAAAALLLADDLPEADRAVLLGPWHSVAARPAGPTQSRSDR